MTQDILGQAEYAIFDMDGLLSEAKSQLSLSLC
jgi:hypothetical protein